MKSVLMIKYHCRHEMRETFLKELYSEGIHEAVNGEDGCVKYDYFLDPFDGDCLVLVEKWDSKEQQQVHLTQPHMTKMRAIKEKYVESTDRIEL